MEAQVTPRCESCASYYHSPAMSRWLWVVFGVLLFATIGAGWIAKYEVTGFLWIVVFVAGLITVVAGSILLESNVIGSRAFFFLDEEGKFHTHCDPPIAGMWIRNCTVLDARLVGWFRKSAILGSASVNWKILDARDGKVRVCDRTAKQYELWTQEPEEVLRLITRFVSVEDILATLDRRERALDELGIGVKYVIAWAFVDKDRARSPHAQRLREQLQVVMLPLFVKGHLTAEREIRWQEEAQARLAAETKAVRSPTAPADAASRKTREKPGEVT